MISRNITNLIALACISMLSWVIICQAQEMAVPVKVQFPLFLKILVFDRNLKERVGDEIVIGIAYQEKFRKSRRAKDEFVNVMKESNISTVEGIPIHQVSIDFSESGWESAILKGKVDILYITPIRALEIKTITDFSRARKITTLTGIPDYVESGIAVGIGTKGDKPRIIINLTAAKAEGADFSSRLLSLSAVKVIEK